MHSFALNEHEGSSGYPAVAKSLYVCLFYMHVPHGLTMFSHANSKDNYY